MISFLLCFLFHYCQPKIVTINPVMETKVEDSIEPMLGGSGDAIYSGAGDGYVRKGDSAVWITTHDAVTGSSFDYTFNLAYASGGYNFLSSVYDVRRLFLPFDTSSIPAGATIISATLNVYVTAIQDNSLDGYDYINVVQTTQGDSTLLATKDYNEAGATTTPTLGATSINLGSLTTSAYNTFTLNATGLTWIKTSGQTSSCGTTTGVTCLGIREGHDIDNKDVSQLNIASITTSEGTNKPYLTVVYIIPTPSGSTQVIKTLQIKSGVLQIKK